MDISGIISIAGKPGLYKIIAQSKKGLIVESMIDGKRIPAHITNKISSLEDISVYTYEEDMPLKEVLGKLHAHTNGQPAINPKSDPQELHDFMEAVMPEYDEERVYPSDLKKLFAWYNTLLEKGMLDGAEETGEESEEAPADEEPVAENADSSDDETKEA